MTEAERRRPGLFLFPGGRRWRAVLGNSVPRWKRKSRTLNFQCPALMMPTALA